MDFVKRNVLKRNAGKADTSVMNLVKMADLC